MTLGRVPYLSIVYAGRKDADGGSNDGFFRALRYNHERLTAAGVRYDILFVEWRRPAHTPLLADVLRAEVPEIDQLLTTLVVDARYHDAFSQNPDVEFHDFIARNVAIRRASGSYILSTRPDIYFSPEVVALFAQRLLRPMVLYLATRVDLKSNIDPTALDETVLRDRRNHERTIRVEPPLFTNAAGEFLLLDRFSWHAIRGFNEVYRVADLHIDASFSQRAHASGILVKDSAATVYRVGNGSATAWQSRLAGDRKHREGGVRSDKPMLYDNPTNWGLGGAPVFNRSRRDFRIEFDAAVVPPLVSLQAVRVPTVPPR